MDISRVFKTLYDLINTTDFWENFIGSFIGTLTALLIFILESRRESKKVYKEKVESNKNILLYFKLLLQSVIDVSEKQLVAYKEHAIALKDTPFEFNLLKIFISEDLARILKNIDQKQLLQAFIEEFGNTISTIKEFKKTFSVLDFIYSINTQILNAQELFITKLDKNFQTYKSLTEDGILSHCVYTANHIKLNDNNWEQDQFYNLLNDAILHYYRTAPNPLTIGHIQNNLVIPLREEIIANFRDNLEAYKIVEECRRATWLYNDIIAKSNKISDEYDNYYVSELETNLNKLKSYNLIKRVE